MNASHLFTHDVVICGLYLTVYCFTFFLRAIAKQYVWAKNSNRRAPGNIMCLYFFFFKAGQHNTCRCPIFELTSPNLPFQQLVVKLTT